MSLTQHSVSGIYPPMTRMCHVFESLISFEKLSVRMILMSGVCLCVGGDRALGAI